MEPSLSQLEGAAGEPTVPLDSEMRGSVSLELDPSVSVIPEEAERAATLPTEPPPSQIIQEGMLCRKHDVEGSGKKASNRWVMGKQQCIRPTNNKFEHWFTDVCTESA